MVYANVKAPYPAPQEKKSPRLVATRHGWHVVDSEGTVCGKIIQCRQSRQFVVVLRGKAAKIHEIVDSGLLSNTL